jgi:hypothetical protein
MKVYILTETEPVLTVKSTYFSRLNREIAREHIKSSNCAKLVWFEDEPVPEEFVEMIQDEMQRINPEDN